MTPEAQRIAIAEACGWRMLNRWTWEHKDSPHSVWPWSSVPNYPSDLKACHEMEKVLTVEQQEAFTNMLWAVCGLNTAKEIRNTLFVYAHATAAQRCEAFLRCIGKWEDGK